MGSPCGASPERSRKKRKKRHQGPGWRHRGRENRAHLVVGHKRRSGKDRHHNIDEHAHPGTCHVNKDDAVGVTLRGVNGADKKAEVKRDGGADSRKAVEPLHRITRGTVKTFRGKKCVLHASP